MPPDSLILRVNLRKLLVVLALTAPLLVGDILWTVDRSRQEFTAASGSGLETVARVAAAGAEAFVDAAVSEASEMAAHPDLLALAKRQNVAHERRTEVELAALDKVWQTPEAGPAVERIVGSGEAIQLREAVDRNRMLASVIVTDRFGATAAASHKPTLYFHGDQAWWRIAFADGLTGVDHASPALWDPVSERDVIAISVPIHDEQEGRIAGVLRTFVPVASLTAFLEEAQPKPAGDAVIADRDGRLVLSAGSNRSTEDEIVEFEALRERIAGEDSGWGVAAGPAGSELLVGFAATGLARRYVELKWSIIVSQPLDEAAAPMHAVNRRVLLSGALAMLLVVMLAVYFTNHREQPLDPLEGLDRL